MGQMPDLVLCAHVSFILVILFMSNAPPLVTASLRIPGVVARILQLPHHLMVAKGG